MSDAMYLNAFDKFLQDPNISMNPLNVVAAYNKNSVLPLAIFYRNHGYRTFILLDDSDESKQISAQLASNEFSPIQTILFERDGKNLESIEDYIVLEDYLHAVNQTYEIRLRKEGYSNLTPLDVTSKGKKGILENLRKIWEEHNNDDWGQFDNEEITTLMIFPGLYLKSTCIGSPFHAGFSFLVNLLLAVFNILIHFDGVSFTSSNSLISNSAK